MLDSRLIKQAKLLVNYSCSVKPGDFVFVSSPEAGKPWVTEVVKEASLAGAHVEYIMTSEDADEVRLKYAGDHHFKGGDFIMETMLSRADVWLRGLCGVNTRFNSNAPADRITAEIQARSAWRKLFRDRYGNGSLRWAASQFPTVSYAQEASMSLSEYEDFVYGAMLLDFDDPVAEWQKVGREQERWVQILNGKNKIRVIAEGTDIIVGTSGRKWKNCDGKINMPDGELFTGPIEHEVNGVISFSFPGIFEGREIEGIRLEVIDGKVVKATAKKGEDFLLALLNTDAGSSYFGEFAIGTNYGIRQFTKNILFDEKIGGTIHMAVGNGYEETGSKNSSAVHWDLVCDLRSGGEIYADDELIFKEGKLLL